MIGTTAVSTRVTVAAGVTQTTVTVPFRFERPQDLRVRWLTTANPDPAPLQFNVGYTVTGGQTNDGGTVTLTPPRVGPGVVEVTRVSLRTQQFKGSDGRAINMAAFHVALDRLAMGVQEAYDLGFRGLRFPLGEDGQTFPDAAARAHKFFTFDEAGKIRLLEFTAATAATTLNVVTSYFVPGDNIDFDFDPQTLQFTIKAEGLALAGHGHSLVNADAPGFMSAADKVKLDQILTNDAALALTNGGSVGTSTAAARADHTHPFPSAANVGADPAGTAANALSVHVGLADPHTQYALESDVATALAGKSNVGHRHDNATASADGFMSAADKAKMDAWSTSNPVLSDANPQALATAPAAGTSLAASRADHAHPRPTPQQIGAEPEGSAALAVTAHEGAADPHPQYATDAAVVAALATKENTGVAAAAVTAHEAASDPHPQYATDAALATAVAAAVTAHEAASDPHTQYATDAAVTLALAAKADKAQNLLDLADRTLARGNLGAQRSFLLDVRDPPFLAPINGVGDARAAIVLADQQGGIVTLPFGTYRIGSNLTITSSLFLLPGCLLVPDAGVTVTIEGDLVTLDGDWTRKFSGAGSIVLNGRNRSVRSTWFGGSSSDWAPGVNAAFAAGANEVHTPPQAGTIASTIDIPAALTGELHFHGPVTVAQLITAIRFRRPKTPNTGTLLNVDFHNHICQNAALAQNSILVDFQGSASTTGATITRSGSTATVSKTGHGLPNGARIYNTGWTQAEYNGIFTITVVDANTFTFPVTGTPATPATGAGAIAPLDDVRYHDNRLVLRNGEARGFFRSWICQYAQIGFENFVARFCAIPGEMLRDASFCFARRLLLAGNLSSLLAVDPVPNGASNALAFDQFYAVGNGGAGSLDDVYVYGWQSVIWKAGSVDLSTAGQYCVRLDRCDDMYVDLEWLASDKAAAPNHEGALLAACPRGAFAVNTLINHRKGVTVTTVASDFSLSASDYGTCPNVRIETSEGVTGATLVHRFVKGAHFDVKRVLTAAARSGAEEYEIWAAGGSGFHAWGITQMRGPAYAINDNIHGTNQAGFTAQWLT